MDYESFCRQFGDFVPTAYQDGERYYFLTEEVAAFRSGEQRKPYARGLYLGMGRTFVPTPALLTLLARHSKRKAVLTNERSEWLFLCGRDIFADGFRSEYKEGAVLVQNEHDENVGLAKITQGRDGLLLKNILDRGNYLRHETITFAEQPQKKYTPQKKYGRDRPKKRFGASKRY